jgi:predicted PolB exonuclease-like 3'-5' exonuclease
MGFGDNGTPVTIFDIETAPHPDAALYIVPPNFDEITAPKNYKDEQKKAEYIQAAKREAQEEYEAKLGRCALDWNLSRIVAIGMHNLGDCGPQVIACKDEKDEKAALAAFWLRSKGRRLVGFCSRTFDAPTLIQRSRYLGVTPRNLSLAKFGRGDVTDLREILTFDDANYTAIMPRSLDAFCKRFGIVVEDDWTGAEVGELIATNNWDGVLAHCRADLERTRRLAERIGVVSATGVLAA